MQCESLLNHTAKLPLNLWSERNISVTNYQETQNTNTYKFMQTPLYKLYKLYKQKKQQLFVTALSYFVALMLYSN